MLWNQPRAQWKISDFSGTPENVRSLMYSGGTHTHDVLGLRIDESMCISDLEKGNQYNFLGVRETREDDVAGVGS